MSIKAHATTVHARLTVHLGEQVEHTRCLRLGERLLLGRGELCDLALEDAGVSRRHASVEVRADGLYVTDLASSNGTWAAGSPLPPHSPTLHLGAPISIGPYSLAVELSGLPHGSGDGSPQADRSPMDLPPVPAEEFEVLGLLGRGGSATVWAARQRYLDRRVAIKVLHGDMAPDGRRRLLQEAQLYCRFQSPRVLRLHDVRLTDLGELCLILELVQGATAGDLLAARGRLGVAGALRIGADVAEALRLLGEAGIVHRDVKPHNVLVSDDGRAKLGDLGIAKVLGSGLTESDVGLGTLAYVAPEQAVAAREAGPEADVYALGATLFELLSGRRPLEPRGSLSERLRQIGEEVPPRISALRPEVTASVDTLIKAMLAKRPLDRPPPAQVGRILDQVLADEYPDVTCSEARVPQAR